MVFRFTMTDKYHWQCYQCVNVDVTFVSRFIAAGDGKVQRKETFNRLETLRQTNIWKCWRRCAQLGLVLLSNLQKNHLNHGRINIFSRVYRNQSHFISSHDWACFEHRIIFWFASHCPVSLCNDVECVLMSLPNANYARQSVSRYACDDGCTVLFIVAFRCFAWLYHNLHITSGAHNLLNNANLTDFKWLFTMARIPWNEYAAHRI